MRVAVVSDIHANLAALEAVLAEIDGEAPDELWCLGDLVGYGPRPSECTELVAARAAICLAGNHDLAVIGKLDLLEFSGDAGDAARWTREVLTDGARAYLDGLEPSGARADVALYHASARDPIWEYVLSDETAAATMAIAGTRLVLVGHSHAALQVALRDETSAAAWRRPERSSSSPSASSCSSTPARSDSRATATRGPPGSSSTSTRTARRFRRVAYDIARTQAEIRDAGLPELLALRLADGQ